MYIVFNTMVIVKDSSQVDKWGVPVPFSATLGFNVLSCFSDIVIWCWGEKVIELMALSTA